MSQSEEQLVRSYVEKQQANKNPTAAEAKAYQRAVDARVLDQLRSITPDFFNQLFGVQNKQRYDWEDRYAFPCGRTRKSIDVIAVLVAIKNLIAANRKYIGIGKAQAGEASDTEIDINEAKRLEAIERRKKTEVQRQKIQIEIDALKRKMIPVDEVRECFDLICSIWVRISKQLQKTGYEDAWEIVETALEEARESFDKEISSGDTAAAIQELEAELQREDDQ